MMFEDVNERPTEDMARLLDNMFDGLCQRAADRIHQADVLLLVTGAGFSADSGLAVYADVANVPAYQSRDLTYMDICQPHWLVQDPELFYGFWGQCFNDYRETKPHEGYNIIAGWRDDKNLATSRSVAEKIRKRIRRKIKKYRLEKLAFGLAEDETNADDRNSSDEDDEDEQEKENLQTAYPLATKEIAGAFFSFTSNVDAHSFDVFHAHEVMECHGNIELWQCSSSYCTSGIWRAPLLHHFIVDQETMVAPMFLDNNHQSPAPTSSSSSNEDPTSSAFECSVCNRKVLLGSFSNRQRNKAQMGYGGKCPDCAAVAAREREHNMMINGELHNHDQVIIDSNCSQPTTSTESNMVDKQESLTSPSVESSSNITETEVVDATPHIGHALGKGRRINLLQHMPDSPSQKRFHFSEAAKEGSDSSGDQSSACRKHNWVRCGHCNGTSPARPAILMFGDFFWKRDKSQHARWTLWSDALLHLCKHRASENECNVGEPLKVCIVEVGCGMNVPTCRKVAERMVKDVIRKGGNPTLVRINPDLPLSIDDTVGDTNILVPIMSRGLAAIQNIDRYYRKLKAKTK